MKRRSSTSPRVENRCSFCGKAEHQVHRFIAGPNGVYICDECVDLCQEIIAEEPHSAPEVHQPAEIEPAVSETTADAATDSNAALLEVLGKIRDAVRIQGKIQDQLEKLLQEALEKR